ncbi:MAG: alpha/beta fold hydrolase, partial [Deltaproteobacteria bacterium]|nr:alpha/beta fold hydrolase [Deltaproteobacteria bacterium]
FVRLDALPLTPNGKIVREALPDPELSASVSQRSMTRVAGALERRIIAIWETVLGVRDIQITDSFFDLGGHSLLAVQLLKHIEIELGRRLPLAILLEAATVQRMAVIIQASPDARYDHPLIPLQREGTRPPLFLLPPLGAHVLTFRRLVQLLGRDQPSYGLQLPDLEGRRGSLDKIEEAVELFVQLISEVQPNGPYHLAGYSQGGVVAYEIARQLSAGGHVVALLAMLDAAVPGSHKERPWFGRIAVHISRLRQRSAQDKVRYLREGVARRRASLIADIDHGYNAADRARRFNVATPYDGKITLLRSAEPHDWMEFMLVDPLYGWGELASGGVEVHEILGSHLHILEKPSVRTLADTLAACLEEARLGHSGLEPA